MKTRKQIILPKLQEILDKMGEQFKLARKIRSLTLLQVAYVPTYTEKLSGK